MEKENSRKKEGQPRRKVLKLMALGTTALTVESILPDQWVKPVTEFIVLPAHAETSGEIDGGTTDPTNPTNPPVHPIDGSPDIPTEPVQPPGPTEPPSSFDANYSGSVTLNDNSGDAPVSIQASVQVVYTAPTASVTVTINSAGGGTCVFAGTGDATAIISLANIFEHSLNCPSTGLLTLTETSGSNILISVAVGTFVGGGELIRIS
ncbi:MAG: hypothetical protein ABFS19_11165 [Thermodesulfobacteriota bacterium]